jgi:cell division protein FtsI (penicillin-binding protein 3)
MTHTRGGLPGNGRRALLVAAVLLTGFACVTFRLVLLQVIRHGQLTERAHRQQNKVVDLPAGRGSVFDRNGRELAVSVDAMSLYGIPSRVDRPRAVAARLAPIIGSRVSTVAAKLSTDRSFVWLARKTPPDVPAMIQAAGGFDGMIGWLDDSRRYYPNKSLAAHVLGFTGTDGRGLEGIEAKYEPEIGGSPGKAVTRKDGAGREIFSLDEGYVPPSTGDNLVLTLDEQIQYIVEKELDRIVAQFHPVSATAIVMEPKTGEILAMANRPGFNPNNWQRYRPQAWRNRAVTDTYEPGSTFKLVTAAAALDEKVISPSDGIYCGDGFIRVGGRTIHDAHKETGSLTFSEVIQKSSNVGTIKVALMLGPERLYKYARAFGFGDKTGVDLPGEASGTLRDLDDWSGVSVASVAIGQEVAVTPLQMLDAMNTIANGGVRPVPYIVSEVVKKDGAVKSVAPEGPGTRVISAATAAKLTKILCTVVEEGGTAIEANVRGYQVAGKTGTAQKFDPSIGRYSKERYTSSFVGFVPADDPRISVIVVVNEPKGEIYGGLVAAPAFRSIVEQTMVYLKVPTRLPDHIVLVER